MAVDSARELAATLPNAELVEVPDDKHLVFGTKLGREIVFESLCAHLNAVEEEKVMITNT